MSHAAKQPLIRAETHILENGLKIIVLPSGSAPIVSIGVLYHVGTADDPADQVGLSHFMEHMMFKGTKSVPSDQFKKRILTNGGNTNALTEYDYTLYYTTIASSKMELILQMEADRLRSLAFSEDEITSEKKVVLEERGMRIENNPFGAVFERYLAAMHPYHPYGVPPIGYTHHIQKYSFESVRKHYDTWYHPNNATLIITGKTTLEEVLPLVKQYFADIPSQTTPKRIRPQNPQRDGVTQKIAQYNQRNALIILLMAYDAPNYTSPSGKKYYYPLQVLAQILGGNEATDFSYQLVDEKKKALQVSASYDGNSIDPKDFSIVATLSPDMRMDQIQNEITGFVQNIISNGVSQDTLSQAKNDILAWLATLKDGTDTYLMAVGQALGKGHDLEAFNTLEDRINAVTAAEVQEAASAVLNKNPAVVVELYPESMKEFHP